MRMAAFALIGFAVFSTSVTSTYVVAKDSMPMESSTTSVVEDAEILAHESATSYVLQEFPDNAMERTRLLGYEEAVHMAMSAKTATAVHEAAAAVLRAQNCNGFLGKGHHTTVARDAILYLHRAGPEDPRWRRIIATSSRMASEPDDDPCVAPMERLKKASDFDADHVAVEEPRKMGRIRRSPAFHVRVTSEAMERALSHPKESTAQVRMRLD